MDDASTTNGNGRTAGPISETMLQFFNDENWSYLASESEPILRIPFQGNNGQWLCYAQAREDQEQFVFYSICPAIAPEERRAAMAEFITRANYGVIIGNFEMDFRDGELRYKTSLDVEGDALSPALLRSLVYANVAMMDHYLPGIMAVLYGNVSPAEAIEQIEGGS